MERQIVIATRELYSPFSDILFKHNRGASFFDFTGLRDSQPCLYIDIKCRDINADDYEDYFVGREKVDFAKSCGLPCYIIYKFNRQGLVRLFNLTELIVDDEVVFEEVKIFHKRAEENMIKQIYKFPRRRKIFEFYHN